MSVSMENPEGKSFENPAYANTEDPTANGVISITSANQVSHLERLCSYHTVLNVKVNLMCRVLLRHLSHLLRALRTFKLQMS